MKTKIIVGYKLRDEQYEKAVEEIIKEFYESEEYPLSLNWWNNNAKNNLEKSGYHFTDGTSRDSIAGIFKEKELIDIFFTPVYKEEKGIVEKPTEGEMNWVNIEDKLPKEGGRYWCFLEHQGDLGKSTFQWNCSYDEVNHTFQDSCLKDGERVTHWMPLPEPPKTT